MGRKETKKALEGFDKYPLKEPQNKRFCNSTLVEVVREIRKHQESGANESSKKPSNELLLETPITHSQITALQNRQCLVEHPSDPMIGAYSHIVHGQMSQYLKKNGYDHSRIIQQSNKAAPKIGLTNEEVMGIMEDAKMRSWGLGGSGKHIPFKTREVYEVVKLTTESFAMNQILYRLALN